MPIKQSKKRKMRLWGISNQDTGVSFYRINQPLRFIGRQKLATIHTLPFFGQHVQHLTSKEFIEYYEKEGKWADVLYSTLASDREYLSLLLGLRDFYKLKLVIDIDDDILSTHLEPNNPAHKAYMGKDAKFAEYAQACLYEADMVIASTDYLKEKYRSINPNIHVVKNCVDPSLFTKSNEQDDSSVVIGYAGSGSHQADWKMVEPVLAKLKEKYKIKVKILGPMYTTLADDQVNWVDMLQYPKKLASMQFDIGIAPLRDSMMARAKSNLRWLEYSALSIPTVASDVVPFRGVKNIIRVSEPEEWYEELERLILDAKLRTEIGRLAYNEVINDYDPAVWAQQLFTTFNQLP